MPGGRSRVRVFLTLRPPLKTDIARGAIRTIEEKTIAAFPDFSRDYIKKQLNDRQAQLEKELSQAIGSIDQLRTEIARDTGLPTEKAAEQLAEISRQQIDAELALVGMEAREKAIAREIEKCKSRMEDSEAKDETVSTLQRLLKLRMDRLDREKQLHQTGVSPEQDVRAAEADVLTAKIDLDKTRAALKRAAGGEQLDAFTGELSRLAIDRAETQARRDWLEKLSKETSLSLTERREAERRLESLKPKLAKAEQERENYQTQLQEARHTLENIQPLQLVLPDEATSDDSK
jgi:DNA repair exonuclease SbcCD ATPase subunit